MRTPLEPGFGELSQNQSLLGLRGRLGATLPKLFRVKVSCRLPIMAAMSLLLAVFANLVFATESGPEAQAQSSKATPPPTTARKGRPVQAGAAQPELDGIMSSKDELGRIVYVNAPVLKPTRSAETQRPRRSSSLVYWSEKEKRWKPVPPPTPSAMQAARSAAEEVVSYLREVPSVQTGFKPQPLPLGVANGAVVGGVNQQGPASSKPNGIAADLDSVIEQAAARHQVDPNLVRAIIKVESNFNPRALSNKGAMGLMQLMPDTARRLRVNHPFDPQENVDGGVRHLKSLLKSFGGDVNLSLAAYNAGETAVLRNRGVPNYSETRNYVKQITSIYWNGGPITASGRSSPIRVFRGSDGVLTITND